MSRILPIIATFLGVHFAFAQPHIQVDTLPNEGAPSHCYLNIQIPSGEMYMQSSRICGKSISKLASSDPSARFDLQTDLDDDGNLVRNLALNLDDALQPKAATRGMVSADVSRQLLQFNSSENTPDFRSVFNPDPSTSTDLYLDLGIGRSRFDFSDLSLNRVEIHSAFSDVHITYTSPNRISMEKMDIHAAKARIVLKNLEFARAELVSVINDMGDTKLIIGSAENGGATIFIQQGMGDCILVVHPDHPLKIVVKNGLFTTSNLAEEFIRHDKGSFINEAYDRAVKNPDYGTEKGPKITTIVCNVDFGNVQVITAQ